MSQNLRAKLPPQDHAVATSSARCEWVEADCGAVEEGFGGCRMEDVRAGNDGKLFEVGTSKGGEIKGDNGASGCTDTRL